MTAPVRVFPAPINIAAPRVNQAETGLLSLAVDATAQARTPGPEPDRWMGGYAYRPALPGNIVRNASQITGSHGAGVGTGQHTATVETIPWTLEVLDQLSTVQRNEVNFEAQARQVMEDYTSYLLERELWLGEIKAADNLPNRVLTGASTTVITGTPTPQTAAALLVGALNCVCQTPGRILRR
jgi:hypothetical protein